MRVQAAEAPPVKIEPNRSDPATVGVADEDAQALSEMLQTLASQRNRKHAELLGHIDRALRAMEEAPEMVGLCVECEEEIPDKRLALMPYARLCAACQGKREPKRGETRRRLTDLK